MANAKPILSEIRVFDRFPLIVVEFSGAADDAQFAAYLAELEAVSVRRAARLTPGVERTAVLIDTTDATRPVTASQRRMQAEYMARMRAKPGNGGGDTNAVCFVIKNVLVRGVLTAILWLQPMHDRYKVCATREEAELWCKRWIVGLATQSEPPSAHAG